jgi:hypothetical protein
MATNAPLHLAVEVNHNSVEVKKEENEVKRGSRPQRKKVQRTKANVQRRPAKVISKKKVIDLDDKLLKLFRLQNLSKPEANALPSA